MNALTPLVGDYMEFRLARGLVASAKIERMLRQFVASLPDPGESGPVFTVDQILAWVNEPTGTHPSWMATRLSMVRQFAIYLSGSGVLVEIPSTRLVRARPARAVPYIYDDHEIEALIEAAWRLHRPLRAASIATLIGLLSVTGMRIGEALNLDVGDFDPQRRTLLIRNAKYGRQRVVILHETACAALDGGYLSAPVRQQFSLSAEAPLLVNTLGGRLAAGTVSEAWSRIVGATKLSSRPSARPRIHDLRHTFATRTMIDAYANGRDTGQTLAALAIWLGHSSPAFTYWYIQAVPELAATAISLLDPAQEELS